MLRVVRPLERVVNQRLLGAGELELARVEQQLVGKRRRIKTTNLFSVRRRIVDGISETLTVIDPIDAARAAAAVERCAQGLFYRAKAGALCHLTIGDGREKEEECCGRTKTSYLH